ncbi:hypothetical protein SCP_0202010 [Sparassis crispa]|uniref:DUF6534 domain-containing protein n=1 Tax=Sparassis crispa TaxID=139825 RepID=A0A401GA00_9APHY|nr:hypothetical protein SCP_0202010 [Sparassis crispa]GBE79004.1 hypothetical protein SCP_0202010 [Sparassis crispa]
MASPAALIESTLGYQFIGFAMATSCYGITMIQGYIYYCNYKEDRPGLKAFVYFICALDTLCSALVSHALYVVLIMDWGNVIALERFPWSFALENGVTVFITFLVQWSVWSYGTLAMQSTSSLVQLLRCEITVVFVFNVPRDAAPNETLSFAVRKKLALASAAVAFTGLVAFGAGIALTCQLFITKFYDKAVQGRFFLIACGLDQGAAALCDIIVTVSFTWGLLSERMHGAKQTRSVIERLISYTVTRGILTTIIQVLMVVVFCSLPTKDVWMLAHLILSKVYINTMLAILNGRRDLREVIDKTVVLRTIDFRHGNTSVNTSAAIDESFSRADSNNLPASPEYARYASKFPSTSAPLEFLLAPPGPKRTEVLLISPRSSYIRSLILAQAMEEQAVRITALYSTVLEDPRSRGLTEVVLHAQNFGA